MSATRLLRSVAVGISEADFNDQISNLGETRI